jgi:antitoxin component of MazEF toxin-antitoxin module
MYDALTSRYTFSCPARGESRVALSAFRTLEPLPGTAHPVVYQVRFACPCGDEHDGLVSHDELDWAPLGLEGGVFLNLMTSRFDLVGAELGELAAARIKAGEWPWSFFCYPEERPRPVFPSAFLLLAPGDGSLGLAVRCPACLRTSVNLVSHEHVDVPFHNDREIAVVEHVFDEDARATLEEFRAELWSARFDARRLALE